MNHTTRPKLVCAGFALLLAGSSYAAIRLANRSLAAAGAVRLPCPDGDYVWVSNRDVMSFITRETAVSNKYDTTQQDHIVTVTAQVTNTASGGLATVRGFTAQLSTDHAGDTSEWRTSRDGHLLLYGPRAYSPYYNEGTAPLSIWNIADGSQDTIDDDVYAGIEYSAQGVLWMPDGSKLLIAKDDSGRMAALYNSDANDDATAAIPLAVKDPIAVGITPDSHLIYTDLTEDRTDGVPISDQEIGPTQGARREFRIKLPLGDSAKEISLSPDGKWLAMAVSSIHTPPGYQLIKKIAPKLAVRIAPRPVISLFICRLDGTDMRLLGMEDTKPNAAEETIQHICWRPDGKWISYRWHKGVYVVPAD